MPIRSRLYCVHCGSIIESKHVHDFQRCLCGKSALDGGLEYIRVLGASEDSFLLLPERHIQGEYFSDIPPKPAYPELPIPDAGSYIRFSGEYYGWFVPAKRQNVPLMVILPGYEASLKQMPDLQERFHTLFLSPLGYGTPWGPNEEKRRKGTWPVFFDTVLGTGEETYNTWIIQVINAIRWIQDQTESRGLVFVGTSQGGGMALVLGSLFSDETLAVCADEPWLVGFSTEERIHDVIEFCTPSPELTVNREEVELRLRAIDPLCHAERLTMPVLLTAGEKDLQCPPKYIKRLFEMLPANEHNRYVTFPNREHGYHRCFFDAMTDFLETISIS